jgi:hypothetical protein
MGYDLLIKKFNDFVEQSKNMQLIDNQQLIR